MSTSPPTDTFTFGDDSAHNQAALEELVSAIAFGQGTDTITLLLVRCNYGQLRDRMVAALLTKLESEDLQGAVHVLRLQAHDHNLYGLVQVTTEEQRPGAVLVVGTEAVDSLEMLLVEMNKRREEFRRDFPFPLVLWFTDDGYRQLSHHANDFESIAGGETIEFRLAGATLAQQLQQAAQRMFAALLAADSPASFNDRLENLDLGSLQPQEVALALADLQAQAYPLDPDLQASVAFAQGLNLPNDEAVALFEQSAAHWQGQPETSQATLKRGLALFYLGRAHYFIADNAKYRQPNWARAVPPLQECLQVFEQAGRPDLVAQSITQLERTLRRLERWHELHTLAQRSLALHQTHGPPSKLAQDYGHLAAVALQQHRWPAAAAYARQALDTLPPGPSSWRILFLKTLADAEYAAAEVAAATEHLQAARAMGVMEHPKLYSDVLTLLQQCLRDQRQYLQAFTIKRQRLAIEKQYGLRAFIGAGRLRAQRTEQQATVRSERQTLEDIAPEITASGRSRDLNQLLNRIAGKTHKLLVLHGASGVGKSSLVNGGLLPALQGRALDNRDNLPVLMRQYTNWAQALATRLDQALALLPDSRLRLHPVDPRLPSTPQHPIIPYLLTTLRQCEAATLRPVLIFDQFEEFFFAHPDPLARRDFFQFIADCLELQPSALKIVLSLRQDYLHYLLEAKQLVRLNQLAEGSMARSQLEDILGKQVLYEIGNFAPADAKAIIQQLASGSRMFLEPALIDALVADLAGPLQEVRPIEMQIVGAQLQTEGIQTLDQYRHLGEQPKETLVQRYLEDVVIDCGEENRQLVELVLFLLTDERGTRPLKTKPELLRDLEALGIANTPSPQHPLSPTPATNAQDDTLDLVLQILCGSGIGIHLPDSPDDRYQLVHDYLAGVIREHQAPRLEKLVAELEEERKQRQLAEARRAELVEMNQAMGARIASMRTEQQELQHKNQRARRILAGTVAAAALVATITGSAAIFSTRQARTAKAEAYDIELSARQEQTAADLAVARANFNVGVADILEAMAAWRSQAARQEVEAANNKLAAINHRAQQEQREARAAIQAAQVQVTAAEAASQQAQANLEQARIEQEQALRDRKQAQLEATLVRRVANLERAGVTAAQKFQAQETEGLMAAFRAAHEVHAMTKRYGLDYLAYNPLLALQTSLTQIRETRLTGHQGGVDQVVFSPDGQRIATSGEDGTARLWDLQGNQLALLEGHQGGVWQVVFSPVRVATPTGLGQRIATGGEDGTARLWDLQGNQLALLEGHQGWVYQVVFSPNGQRIATLGTDGTARLWDLQGNQLALMEGHQGRIEQVVFSPATPAGLGYQIATVGEDGTSRIWTQSGQQIAQYEGYGTLRDDWQYIAVALLPDRSRDDGIVKLWPVYTLNQIDELLTAACRRLTPYLTNNPDVSNADRALCGIPPRGSE